MKKKPAAKLRKAKAACPVCASPQVALKYTITRHGFDVFACADCNSQFQYPLPPNADAYYDEGYYTGEAAFSYQDERRKERYHNFVHHARLAMMEKFLGPSYNGQGKEKFLDVGCAFGAFVRAASGRFEAAGLDVSAYAVREGNKISGALQNDAQLFCGDLTHLPRGEKQAKKFFVENSIAVITLIEVAEHLAAPRAALAQAFKLLKPGGILAIQTANFEGLQAARGGENYHYYLPGHLVYFTATGLKRMLREIGFREFKEFFPVDFPLSAKWRKAWGDVTKPGDLMRFWKMSLYHLKSKLRWAGRPLTSSYVLYARK